MSLVDERMALSLVLDILRHEGDAWLRRVAPGETFAANRIAQGKFSALDARELSHLFQYSGSKTGFDPNKVIFLRPPAKEEPAVAALWCRWDYGMEQPRCGFYFGLWSRQPAFPAISEDRRAERHVAFVGYRFETPEDGDNHNYFHSQPCRSMGAREDEIEDALPLSNRMPTWPLAAENALELLLCLVTAIYGMGGLRDLQNTVLQDTRARKNKPLLDGLKAVLRRAR